MAAKIKASKNGKVHAVRTCKLAGYLVLECSGRAMSGMMVEGDAVEITCKSCLKKSS